MTIYSKLKYLPIAAFAAVGVALAGCGGGSDDPPVSTVPTGEAPPVAVADLGADGTIEAGTYQLTGTPEELAALLLAVADIEVPAEGYAPGETVSIPGIGDLTCTGDENCSVEVADDGTVTTTGTIMTAAVGEGDGMAPEPVLNELQTAQAAAAAAATAAMTAAGNANTAADDAETARANAATIQTGRTSGGLAQKARKQAVAAQASYMDAKTASDAAAAAESLADAIEARIMAENARDDAQEAETNAGNYARMAMDAVDGELMIDGTMKSVGDTTIDAEAPNQVITTTIGGKTSVADTGLQGELEEEMTGAATGRAYAAAAPDADPPTAEDTYRQQVAARDVTIGKTVDSADDTARLAIITSYAGSKTVKVFAYAETAPEVTTSALGRVSTTPGKIITGLGTGGAIGGTGEEADVTANLKSLGMFYLAGAATESDGLEATNEVADDAEPSAVYSYVSTADDPTTENDETMLTYLVSNSLRTVGGTTVYVYRSVEVIVEASRRDGADDDALPDDGQVTANIPEATGYEHIHFGVWASLNEDGTDVGGIGIGFVQNFAGAPTEASDMPNHGSATYDGNWVATIQAADPDGNGTVALEDGVASMTADFEEMTVDATLTGLATLSGDITGSTFSGSKVSDITHDSVSNDADDFTGSTYGGFYGTRAAEAGGVFIFTSDGNEDGAFSGAFGGAR